MTPGLARNLPLSCNSGKADPLGRKGESRASGQKGKDGLSA
jgi:hypothetical protein